MYITDITFDHITVPNPITQKFWIRFEKGGEIEVVIDDKGSERA